MQNLAKRPEQRSADAQTLGRALAQAARAGGLSPEDLVPRSPLLGAPARQPAFASVEPTKQLPLAPLVAKPIALPDSAEPPRSERPALASQEAARWRSSSAVFLGGVALAALWARGSNRIALPRNPRHDVLADPGRRIGRRRRAALNRCTLVRIPCAPSSAWRPSV